MARVAPRRVALLVADELASASVSPIVAELRATGASLQIVVERVGAAASAAHGVVLPVRALHAAASADAVIVTSARDDAATRAALAALRSELAFTKDVPGTAGRMWRAASGERTCCVVDPRDVGTPALARVFDEIVDDNRLVQPTRPAPRSPAPSRGGLAAVTR